MDRDQQYADMPALLARIAEAVEKLEQETSSLSRSVKVLKRSARDIGARLDELEAQAAAFEQRFGIDGEADL